MRFSPGKNLVLLSPASSLSNILTIEVKHHIESDRLQSGAM